MVTPPRSICDINSSSSRTRPVKSRGGGGSWWSALTVGGILTMSVPPSTKMFKDAMHMMHEDMNIQYTGDTDADFVRGMIPHHQGAIDMAKIELQEGKDPKIKKMAAEIIKAQEAEIKTMKAWLAEHDKSAAPAKPSAHKH